MKKTVLITGASRGIGRACAMLFSMNGYNVAVNYCSSDDKASELVNLITENGGSAKAYKADVADNSAVKSMVEQINKDFDGIYALINNAGVSLNKVFTDVTDKEWERLSGININGSIFCSQAVLPSMLSKKNGRIINISSIWGVQGASCEAHYSVTKAAIIGLTKALSKEYAQSGITVNCIAPGVIETDMLDCYTDAEMSEITARIPVGRIGNAYDVARAALFLADRGSDFITGQVLGVDGGFA